MRNTGMYKLRAGGFCCVFCHGEHEWPHLIDKSSMLLLSRIVMFCLKMPARSLLTELLLILAVISLILTSINSSYAESIIYELRSQHGSISIKSIATPLCQIAVGQDYLVATLAVENDHPRSIPNVIFITQDIDSNGVVESIVVSENLTVPNAENMEFANNWKPLSKGKHTLEAFVWQLDDNTSQPYPLVKKVSTVIDVAEKCQ